ncbi:MAG TPA: chemotaxis protein CheW [Tenuifilaceae bacterium]|nr:chemotaxis protein CheW [Tenuifilaceae bacterium]HPE17141.1 chemotaxis protein CheW [Tenuifilaceae bacterium]HPJ45869.1 chemotaxis protein CheW [Tenuifilaceae bacterium]HPQ34100.1 chemotaxis protein CheW [Tenuifilaceae bacterium]HRX68729.1 chemotaxis protein CheW [Tenuifilaceae bacterium]
MNQENLSKINSYLSFKLGDEEFAAHVGKVLNILEMTKITEVPKAPEYMKGVINLRGTVLPVIDTRIKFGMTATVYTTNTCIIVLDIEMDGETIQVGALVDAVQAVLEIDKNQIMPPPSIGSKYKSEFIEGVANIDEKFIMILNMDAVFSSDELTNLRDKTEETENTVDIEEVG